MGARRASRAAAMAGLVLAATPALAQRAAEKPAATGAQAMFDRAQAAFDAANWQDAATGYARLLTVMKPDRSAAVVRSRRATALARLGQSSAAAEEAQRAIDAFAAAKVANDDDLAFAWLTLGDTERMDLRAGAAVAAYRKALDAMMTPAPPPVVVAARFGAASALLTVDPAAAAAELDTLIADQALMAQMSKEAAGDTYAARALAALNLGQAKAALPFVDHALDLVGRTTTRIGLPQVRVRGDAALIHAKLGDAEEVRRFLAYSGAGHAPDMEALTPPDADLPVCADDLHPDDAAVVEFAIGADGHAVGAQAIYASRPGAIGDMFARSVSTWRWRPDALAKLSPFWRANVRMELRCVTRPPAIELADTFRRTAEDWLSRSGPAIELDDPTFQPGAAPTGAAAIAADFYALRRAGSDEDAAAAARTLDAALDAAHAPIEVKAYAAFEATRSREGRSRRGRAVAREARLAKAVAAIQQQPGSARAAAWLRTEAALDMETSGALDEARQQLADVTGLPAASLDTDDPIRTLALLHLSLIDKRRGDKVAADRQLADNGVDAAQCSLFDVRPVVKNHDMGSRVFPDEALRWHFEGLAREAFDIGADGKVKNVRTVIAYPPFVFGPATERAVSDWRYLPPTLGNEALGCTGQTVNVNYRIPQ